MFLSSTLQVAIAEDPFSKCSSYSRVSARPEDIEKGQPHGHVPVTSPRAPSFGALLSYYRLKVPSNVGRRGLIYSFVPGPANQAISLPVEIAHSFSCPATAPNSESLWEGSGLHPMRQHLHLTYSGFLDSLVISLKRQALLTAVPYIDTRGQYCLSIYQGPGLNLK